MKIVFSYFQFGKDGRERGVKAWIGEILKLFLEIPHI